MADDRIEQPHFVDRTEHHSALAIGTCVGRYKIASVLGQGAFGITYRARDLQLDRDVALKEYLPALLATRLDGVTVSPRSTEVADDFAWGRARFLDEAKTIARLAHAPAVVHVHDFLEANGTAYVVMNLVEGETLAARHASERRLSPSAIERILSPLLDGLEQVHATGVLHRDIKPENIIIGIDGAPTLIDFGASRVAIAGRTQTLTAVFTPTYAAPEQYTSGQQGPYTDIYAMAATLYASISGREPISAAHRMMSGAAMPSAREAAGGRYSHNLLSAIDAGLLLRAEERPQTIREWRQVFSTGNWPKLQDADQTALDQQSKTQRTAKPIVKTVRRARHVVPLVVAAAVVAVGLVGAAAAWWFGRDHQAASAPGLEAQLESALAKAMPRASPKFHKDEATAFVHATTNRALAVAPKTGKLRYTAAWPTRDLAEEKVLEKCQQIYDEPCAVIAVNDAVLPPGADGTWPVRDAPRVRYTGAFNLERMPAMRAADLQRPEIFNYPSAPAPKAMALNAWGVLAAVTGSTSQRGAEEQALQACKSEALRLKADAVCYLYAVDNRVVLPLRAAAPITAATAPAAAPPPPEATVRTRLLEGLARIVPSQPASVRESQVAAYESSRRHKAIAAFPPSSSWRSSGWASAALAEERALEGCQVRHGAPCILVAVDDLLQPPDAAALRRPMPRAEYDGPFDPQKIPAVDDTLRHRPDVAGYRAAKGPKAAAYQSPGRLVIASGAESQREAEERALTECNADPQRNNRDGPCLLYAVEDQVVLTKRATVPVALSEPRRR
jgi:serine/threonine protein kinase